MHCLLGAWFMLLQEAEPLAPNEFFVKQHSLPEIFTLFSSSFPPGSNLQYCRGLAPVKQMTFFLLILQIVAYHDFPRNWLLSISPYPSEQLGNEMWQFWDLRKTVLFRLSPFHPQGLWKLGCLKQPRFPPWLTVPKVPCQGAPSHDPPAQGMIPWQSTRQFSRVPSFHATAAVAVLFLPRSRDWVCPQQLH